MEASAAFVTKIGRRDTRIKRAGIKPAPEKNEA